MNTNIYGVYKQFIDNVNSVNSITNIGSDVADIVSGLLIGLKRDNEKISGFIPYKQKLDVVINQIKEIKEHPILKEKYSIIYNQALVLLVSNFEYFFNNLVKVIVDNYSELIKWPKEDKKIVFEVGILDYKVPSIGEIVLQSLRNEFNFQDLQSTLKFLSEYLQTDVKISEDLKDEIIKYQACRHVIVHAFSKVDPKFLKQVANTKYSKKFSHGSKIVINQDEYILAKNNFLTFSKVIVDNLKIKLTDTFGEEYVSEIES